MTLSLVQLSIITSPPIHTHTQKGDGISNFKLCVVILPSNKYIYSALPSLSYVSIYLFLFPNIHSSTRKSITNAFKLSLKTIIMTKVIVKPFGCTLHIRSTRSSNIKCFRPTIGLCDDFEFNLFSILCVYFRKVIEVDMGRKRERKTKDVCFS